MDTETFELVTLDHPEETGNKPVNSFSVPFNGTGIPTRTPLSIRQRKNPFLSPRVRARKGKFGVVPVYVVTY